MGNPQGKRRSWTLREDRYLMAYYAGQDRKSVDQIAQALGRTRDAVFSRAKVLGIYGTRKGRDAPMRVKTPNEHTAYLLGVYLTDGWIEKNYRFLLKSIDREFCEETLRCIKEVLDGQVNEYIYDDKSHPKRPMYRIEVTSRDLVHWLSFSTARKGMIPREFLFANRNTQLALLAGLMDGDGWISQRKDGGHLTRHYIIGIATDPFVKGWIDDMPALLDRLGIRYRRYPREDGMVHIHLNKKDFALSGAYFRIRRKQARLERLKELYGVPSTTTLAASLVEEGIV